MNILIVEDEAIAAERLIKMLSTVLPNAQICGLASSIAETLDWLDTHDIPDLVLMDVHLADGTCFSIFDVADVPAPIIFCTAYDEFALKAFQTNGIAYLLKPVREDDLKGAIDKLTSLRKTKKIHSETRNVLRSIGGLKNRYKTRFLIKSGNRLMPLEISEIGCFMAQPEGVKVYKKTGDDYFLEYSLTELEGLLDPDMFFRVNRQAIVSIVEIKSASTAARNMRVTLKCLDQDIPVARERAKAFRQWLEA